MHNFKALKRGSFGKKIIFYQFLKTNKNNNYFIFLHGTYGSSFKKKYASIADKIIKNNLGNVLLYETSRKIYTFENEKLVSDFEEYTKTFAGKTFKNELDDVRTIFDFFIKELVTVRNPNLHLIGSSLGGTLASYLIKDYKKHIKSIILLGSGISTKGKNKPILSDYDKSQEILANFANFSGNLTLVQGTKDTIVPVEEARKIIFKSKNAKTKKLIILNGVDHTFKFINGVKKETELTDYIFKLIEFEAVKNNF